jgi:ABC-type transporter MlaC component
MNKPPIKSIFFASVIFSVFGISSTFAQIATPESLVKDLYKIHAEDFKNDKDRIVTAKSRKNLDKFFSKTLADYFWKDLNSKGNEVGVLEFDPFYEGQDALIKNLVVGKAKLSGEKATVIVKFLNFNEKHTLTYKFVKENSAWKISDIKYADGLSLLQIFIDDGK